MKPETVYPRPPVATHSLNETLVDPIAASRAPDPAPRFSIRHRQGAWRDALRRRMLAAADVTAVATGFGLLSLVGAAPPMLWCLLLLPVWVVLAKLHGLY